MISVNPNLEKAKKLMRDRPALKQYMLKYLDEGKEIPDSGEIIIFTKNEEEELQNDLSYLHGCVASIFKSIDKIHFDKEGVREIVC
jgi:hypothetical protein